MTDLTQSLLRVCVGALALTAAALSARAVDDEQRDFLWNQANSLAAAAHSPEEFKAAADVYDTLALQGVRNGALFFNQGTCRLMAREYARAVQAFLRSERYAGASPELARNLELALAAGGRTEAPAVPWYRVPLFWHYGLPCPLRATVAAGAFSALWLAAALALVGRRAAARTLAAWAATACVVFGTSVVASLQAEARAGREADVARRLDRAPAATHGGAP
jgi:hypothetical protein